MRYFGARAASKYARTPFWTRFVSDDLDLDPFDDFRTYGPFTNLIQGLYETRSLQKSALMLPLFQILGAGHRHTGCCSRKHRTISFQLVRALTILCPSMRTGMDLRVARIAQRMRLRGYPAQRVFQGLAVEKLLIQAGHRGLIFAFLVSPDNRAPSTFFSHAIVGRLRKVGKEAALPHPTLQVLAPH